MTAAVNNWLGKKGELLSAQPDISLKHYAAAVGVPFETFRKYTCSDVGKRRVLGAAAGKAPVIDNETAQFAVDVMRRKDRANDGLNKRSPVDMMHDLLPGSTPRAYGSDDRSILDQ